MRWKTVPITILGLVACTLPAEVAQVVQSGLAFEPACSAASDALAHSWQLALERAKSAYSRNKKRIKKKGRVALINFVTTNDSTDRLRLYDPTQDWKHPVQLAQGVMYSPSM